jgi:hypothetical protein
MNAGTRRALARLSAAALVAAGAWIGPPAAYGQAATPDLSGIWTRAEGTTRLSPPVEELLNGRGRALRGVLDEQAYPKYDCVAATMPRITTDSYNFQIRQEPDRVLLMYEKDDVVRTVWLRGHGHPEPKSGEYFLQGYSTGWYEGDALLVETTRFVYDPHGFSDGSPTIASSQRKKVTERYRRDGELLRVEVSTVDPLMLNAPYRFHYSWEPTDEEWLAFECDVENSHTILPFLPERYGP